MAREVRKLSARAVATITKPGRHSDGAGLYLYVEPTGAKRWLFLWAGEATAFPREIAEAAFAHTVGDATERAYRRGDALAKRRKLMEALAGFVGQVGGGKVVQLGRKAG